jgi:isoleucyl-tRNA synthetase
LVVITKLIAPIFSFTSEEVWQNIREKIPQSPSSIHLTDWPQIKEEYIDQNIEGIFQRIIEIRDMVLKSLEENRISSKIGSSLEAKVTLYFDREEDYNFFKVYREELPSIFITSAVVLEKADEFRITVERADGEKCIRCWMWSDTVGQDREHNLICKKCLEAIKNG